MPVVLLFPLSPCHPRFPLSSPLFPLSFPRRRESPCPPRFYPCHPRFFPCHSRGDGNLLVLPAFILVIPAFSPVIPAETGISPKTSNLIKGNVTCTLPLSIKNPLSALRIERVGVLAKQYNQGLKLSRRRQSLTGSHRLNHL